MIYNSLLSFIIIIAAYYLFFYSKSSQINRLIFNGFLVLTFSLHILYFVAYYFNGEGVNTAVLYHINYGLAGASFLEYWKVILLTITSMIFLFLILSYLSSIKRKSKFNKKLLYLAFILIIISLLINPVAFDLYKIYIDKDKNIKFSEYYKEPNIQKIAENKNLVFIYTESLERTYFNVNLFPDLIEGLKNLEKRSVYFTDIRQVAGTSWTIGGMVSSQLGIPLFTPINSKDMHKIKYFLPEALGVGDFLKEKGYFLSYYGGADLEFQGKGKFYETHGFNEIRGLNNLKPLINKDSYLNNWGINDDILFELVFKRYLELAKTKDKFGLFLINLGTHHPKGHIPKDYENIKYKNGDNPILNAVKASDKLITNFVKKIISSQYFSDTVIVIASDHLAMRNTAFDILEGGRRRNLFMIISPDFNDSKKVDKRGSTLDIGPTIMSFLGYKAEFGLGRNLLDQSISSYEIKQIQENLIAWKENIQSFWIDD